MTGQKRVFIIAGPNGAGKTTFAREFLPNEAECPTFINADFIAAGLSPFEPEAAAFKAGRLMVEALHHYVAKGENFAFETTLSGRRYARWIPLWQERGYCVNLHFLRLSTPELAIARVRQRVLEGGHNVPEAVIRRRFQEGWQNFDRIYRDMVNSWEVYSNVDVKPVLVRSGGKS